MKKLNCRNLCRLAGRFVSATLLVCIFLMAGANNNALAQIGLCTASILNRTVALTPAGTVAIPNVPYQPGFYRVRVTCTAGGSTTVGQTPFFSLNSAGV